MVLLFEIPNVLSQRMAEFPHRSPYYQMARCGSA